MTDRTPEPGRHRSGQDRPGRHLVLRDLPEPGWPGSDPPGRLLFVCTGNVCRSPLMERLLVSLLGGTEASGASPQVVARSAGTVALVGEPMTAHTMDEVVRLGADPTRFVARQLTADLVAAADLVVTATRAHRASAVTLVPRATRHTFALLELVRLLDFVEASSLPPAGRDRVVGLAAAAAASRGLPPPVAAGADDVPDPYRRPVAEYQRASEAMAPAVTALAEVLGS